MTQLLLFSLYTAAGTAFEFSTGNWIVRLNDGQQYWAGDREMARNVLWFFGGQ